MAFSLKNRRTNNRNRIWLNFLKGFLLFRNKIIQFCVTVFNLYFVHTVPPKGKERRYNYKSKLLFFHIRSPILHLLAKRLRPSFSVGARERSGAYYKSRLFVSSISEAPSSISSPKERSGTSTNPAFRSSISALNTYRRGYQSAFERMDFYFSLSPLPFGKGLSSVLIKQTGLWGWLLFCGDGSACGDGLPHHHQAAPTNITVLSSPVLQSCHQCQFSGIIGSKNEQE